MGDPFGALWGHSNCAVVLLRQTSRHVGYFVCVCYFAGHSVRQKRRKISVDRKQQGGKLINQVVRHHTILLSLIGVFGLFVALWMCVWIPVAGYNKKKKQVFEKVKILQCYAELNIATKKSALVKWKVFKNRSKNNSNHFIERLTALGAKSSRSST